MNRIPIKAQPKPIPWIPIRTERQWQRCIMREWALAWRAARAMRASVAFNALQNAIEARNASRQNSVFPLPYE